MGTIVIPATVTNLDVAVSTRAAAVDYTAARAANLDAAVTSRASRPAAATYFGVTFEVGPAVSGVLNDSGALAAGEYEVVCAVMVRSSATAYNSRIALQHRNAANTGNIREMPEMARCTPANTDFRGYVHWPRITVAVNERIRVAEINAVSADANCSVSLFVRAV